MIQFPNVTALVPLGIIGVTLVDNRLCGLVQTTSVSTFLPIVVIRNWEAGKTLDPFSSSTKGMMYTLAALFLLGTVFSAVIVAYLLLQTGGRTIKSQQLILLLMLFLFNGSTNIGIDYC